MAHTGGAYMGPLLKKLRKTKRIEPTRKGLEILGKSLVKHIGIEASKDFAKRGWSEWNWDRTRKISESFAFEVVGTRTIKVTCDYPAIERLLEGVPKHPMTWLVQPPGVKEADENEPERPQKVVSASAGTKKNKDALLIVPFKRGGVVEFRTAPFDTADAWIHPGIAKFTFLRRGLEKGKKEAISELGKEAVRNFLSRL